MAAEPSSSVSSSNRDSYVTDSAWTMGNGHASAIEQEIRRSKAHRRGSRKQLISSRKLSTSFSSIRRAYICGVISTFSAPASSHLSPTYLRRHLTSLQRISSVISPLPSVSPTASYPLQRISGAILPLSSISPASSHLSPSYLQRHLTSLQRISGVISPLSSVSAASSHLLPSVSPASSHLSPAYLQRRLTSLQRISSVISPLSNVSAASSHLSPAYLRRHLTSLQRISGVTSPLSSVSPASSHLSPAYLRHG